MISSSITLSPVLATLIFCVTCIAGFRYRRVWKTEGPRYQYWVFGITAAAGLLVLGFIPIAVPG
ncbi:hypothetical protein [Yoonia sp. BS5-3]|uniref:Uncharacterized protein n=1 Tax=Yoonia phaeophyticola TaxID=3137369 RepID=A0ABZ2V2H1_9RHOB